MLKEPARIVIPDKGGKNDITIDVNWNPEDKESNDCKVLKLTYPDKKTAFIDRDKLMSFLFMVGTPDQQRDLIPQTLTMVREYQTVIGIKATKDIRKGEDIVVPVKFDIPISKEEVIASQKTDTRPRKKSGFIV